MSGYQIYTDRADGSDWGQTSGSGVYCAAMSSARHILESVFGMERTRATQVMLEVHTKGKGVCGVFSFEIAETKVAQVMSIAKQHQHPLLCTMEES